MLDLGASPQPFAVTRATAALAAHRTRSSTLQSANAYCDVPGSGREMLVRSLTGPGTLVSEP
jgi:hypothetical protein